MTDLEKIEEIIRNGRNSNEDSFITALKVTNVFELSTNHRVHIREGNVKVEEQENGTS